VKAAAAATTMPAPSRPVRTMDLKFMIVLLRLR
jgi:hypothetical protein